MNSQRRIDLGADRHDPQARAVVNVFKLPTFYCILLCDQDDIGIHAVCCGPNNYTINAGSSTVYINGKPCARMQDKTKHCGGNGQIIEGSPDVLIDDGASGQGLGSYLLNALQILLQNITVTPRGTRTTGSDTHQASAPAQLVAV